MIIAVSLIVLGAVGDPTPVGVVFWLTAAYGATWLDVLGNIPFMRTVKPRQRIPMTTVFSSWRETSSFAAPALAAAVLFVGPFWVFYFVLAACCLATAVYATVPARPSLNRGQRRVPPAVGALERSWAFRSQTVRREKLDRSWATCGSRARCVRWIRS